MLKKIFSSMLFLFAAMTAMAQTDTPAVADTGFQKTQTLLNRSGKKLNFIGLAVSSEYQYMDLASGSGPGINPSLALVFNRRWSLGVGSLFLPRGFDPGLSDNTGLNLRYGARGVSLEYTPRPHRLVHLGFPIFVGSAFAGLDSLSGERRDWGMPHHLDDDFNEIGRGDRDRFWVIQPNVRVELNIARFLKLYVGAGYRFAAGPASISYLNANGNTSTLGNADFSGISLQAGFKAGIFEYKIKPRSADGRKWFRKKTGDG